MQNEPTGKTADRAMIVFGCFFLAAELFKQIYLYAGSKAFDVWFTPFQLCSLPIWLCLLFLFIKKPAAKTVLYTFLLDFNTMGAVFALVYPEDIIRRPLPLLLHGFLWHFAIIGLGIFIFRKRTPDLSGRGFIKTLPLFALCCLIAEILNVTLAPYGEINMFYISPVYRSMTPGIRQLEERSGILLGIAVYLVCLVLCAYLTHRIFRRIRDRRPKQAA